MSSTTAPPSEQFTASSGQPMWQVATGDQMRRAGELITGKFAERLLQLSNLPPQEVEELVVLDNACGSAIVTARLLQGLSDQQKRKTKVVCGDVQQGMVDYVLQRKAEEGWEGVEVQLVDAQDTKLPSSSFSHVLTAFALMLVPRPLEALAEIHRILLPGGVNGFTTWNRVGWFAPLKRAFAATPGCPAWPDEEKLMNFMDTGRWSDPEFIKQQLEGAGFEDVQVEVREEKGQMESPEMFVGLFGNMFVSFGMKWFTEEEQKEYGEKVKAVLLQQLQEEHGAGKPWELPMVANVVTCRKPKV